MKIIITLLAIFLSYSTMADEIYQESAVELCEQLKQKTYNGKCLKLVKTKTFDEAALSYCAKVGSWNKIKSCLELTQNTQYEALPLSMCHGAKYFNNEFKACMKDIANKSYVSKIELGLCQKEKTFKKQTKCLKEASSKPFEEATDEANKEKAESDAVMLNNLKAEVKKAYNLLRENKTADATILLHDLIKTMDVEKL